jgi:pimeloyl-ACP methyl ester carboxylesterase
MHVTSAKAVTGIPPAEQDVTLELSDGRKLTYATLGAPAGPVVVVLDGPGSRGLARAAAPAATALGVRLLAPDRPGAGGSTAAPRRAITDWPSDHAVLLDALEVDRAGLLAQSAGTPFALAVATALSPRTTGLALMGAVAPLDDPATFAETGKQLRTALTLARRAPWLLRALLRLAAHGARRDPEKAARKFVKGSPPADAAQLKDPALWALHVQATAEILALSDGFANELRPLASPWGLDPAAITVPVALWSGADDTTHPTTHSRRLAALIGDAPVTVVPDTATFGLLPHIPDALRLAIGQATQEPGHESGSRPQG